MAFALGEFADAAKYFGQASAADKSNVSDDLFLALTLGKTGDIARAAEFLERVVASPIALPDKFQQKYCGKLRVEITSEIVPGIVVEVPVDGTGAALLLSEHYQELGRISDAIELLEGLGEAGFEPEILAVGLAELHSEAGDWAKVVEVTDGTSNTDDLTATALAYRAAAFLEQGLFDAALGAANEALKSRARADEVLLAARYQKARVYEAQGKRAMAQKEFERIMAGRAGYADVAERVGRLRAPAPAENES